MTYEEVAAEIEELKAELAPYVAAGDAHSVKDLKNEIAAAKAHLASF